MRRAFPRDLTPAEGRAVSFVSTDDYPAQSLKRQSVGVTNILFRIGTDGRLSDCRLLESSGDPDLDQATCSLFLKRGSFKPARNRNGDPTQRSQDKCLYEKPDDTRFS